ncbi:MAG: type I DNA topoisomerase [Kiritimatiellae bacterium]|nr:type I DNA topoisomerase [Kiritimatiellia bacterium]
MTKKLVIVESPAKAKTINKILGHDYVVKASMGHVRDLPEKKLGVEIENGFKPSYVVIKGKQKVIQDLQAAAKDVEAVYLAPDPDREGEAIAWHLMAALGKQVQSDRFFRVTYNEITAPAIRKAFSNPHRVDQKRVDSQQARRVLDRIVGYMVSPLLWRRIRGGSSAGRVQSVALRLVCEREREIEAFQVQRYWIIGARIRKLVDPRDAFEARLLKIDGEKADLKQEALAEEIVREVRERPFRVAALGQREITKRARPPYITSTLQQAGSSVFGFSPARTMRIAQDLYEGVDFGEGPVGLITYMRTDSVSIAREAQEACRAFIGQRYGSEYVPEKPNFYKSRSTAQEAHEAIRPTDVNRTPEQLESHLKPDEMKLYRLIWQRFVASQMAPARIAQRSADIEAAPPAGTPGRTYLFRASASEVLFPGYMRVTGEEKKKDNGSADAEENGEEVAQLPPLAEGENLECLDCLKTEKETQPPPRYTEATLVRALEENGVGRPSTYAQILSTLNDRKYVEREKRTLRPTKSGLDVNDFLVEHLGELFDVKFTAGMEASLDEIEKGTVEWTGMLSDFFKTFSEWIEKAKGPKANPEDAKQLLEALAGVTEWAPGHQRGKRTFSDEKFVKSLKKQFDEGKRAISQRQVEALARIGWRYKEQLPGWPELAAKLGFDESHEVHAAAQPPLPETLEKLEALKAVKFNEPRQIGSRTFDDSAFAASLRQQAESGRRLSPKQIKHLDRLLTKYADQLGGIEEVTRRHNLTLSVEVEDPENGPLLEMMKHVTQWRDPTTRRGRTWDDHKFYESLRRQFGEKKTLSPKQSASLRKLVRRYADQIPGYDEAAARIGLPPRGKGSPAEANGDAAAE